MEPIDTSSLLISFLGWESRIPTRLCPEYRAHEAHWVYLLLGANFPGSTQYLGNTQDHVICHLSLHFSLLELQMPCCLSQAWEELTEETGKDLEREEAEGIPAQRNPHPQVRLVPTICPGSVDWGSVCFIFCYWWPQAKAARKCLCWQQGAAFSGPCFGEESHVSEIYSPCTLCFQIFPPHPVPRSKQNLPLGVQIPFLTPCLALLENTLAHSIDNALSPNLDTVWVLLDVAIVFARVSGSGSLKGTNMWHWGVSHQCRWHLDPWFPDWLSHSVVSSQCHWWSSPVFTSLPAKNTP